MEGQWTTHSMCLCRTRSQSGKHPPHTECLVTIPGPDNPRPRRLPPLPALFNTTTALAAQATLGGDELQQMLEETQMDAVSYAWDEIKP